MALGRWAAVTALAATLGATGAGCSIRERSDGSSKPAPSNLEVVDAEVIYTPEQTGGNFHDVLLFLHNRSTRTVSLDFEAQLAITDRNDRVVKTIEVTGFSPTIPPGGRGLLKEASVDLPRPVRRGDVKLRADRGIFTERRRRPPAVKVSNVEYDESDSLGGCSVRGDIRSESERKVPLSFAGFVDGKVVTGGNVGDLETGVGEGIQVFPGETSTFEFELISPAMCPKKLENIKVYAG